MTRLTHRTLLTVVAVLGMAAVLGTVLLWPGELQVPEANAAQRTTTYDATLVEVRALEQPTDVPSLTPDAVLVAISARIEDTGEVVQFQMTDETGDLYQTGQKVRLAEIEQADIGTTYYVADFRRSTALIVLAALFAAAVLWFGRLQGLRALLGLVLTFLIIVGFMIPALLDGRSPLLVAVVGSVLIMIVTLYLSHGVGAKTTAAAVGTSLALIITGALSVLFVEAANITGLASEEARMASVQVAGLSLQGLLLAGIVIGGLGVLDDVTMSQSSTVFQLHRANPGARFRELTAGALSVGRDHVAATVNTLFLAYAGASLPLLILFAGSPDPLGTVITTEVVAVEIVRTLVGSVGLIAAVPLTTALAAMLVLGDPQSASSAGAGEPHAASELQISVSTSNYVDETPVADASGDEEWEQRLRDAYRLPPKENE